MIPDSTKIIFLGLCLLGFSAAILIVPMFPEMQESIEEALPHLKGGVLNNVSAGFFNSFLGVGEAIGPIAASILSSAVGFRRAEDLFGTTVLIFAFAFFMLNGKLSIFKLQSQVDKENTKDDQFLHADIGGVGASAISVLNNSMAKEN